MNSKEDATTAAQRIAADLLGNQLQSVERREHDWLFSFSTGLRLQAACPWRVVSDQRIAFGNGDDRQQFGLPAPIDGALKAEELLLGRTIQKVAIRYDSGDLTIAFDGEVSLEILCLSSGYESWEIFQPPYGQRIQVIAMGGGQLAIWGTKPSPKQTNGC